ncbi:mitochondrial 54S ribosomal protein mrpl1 [Blomia tropicalis]|nr:mitochondrial 54S ribosomal protein mrpl1 [Blomia tropicalis]
MAFVNNLLHLVNPGRVLSNRLPKHILGINCCLNDNNDLFFTQKRYGARKGKRIAATREKQKLARIRREEMKNAPPKVWKPKKLLMDKRINVAPKKFNDEDRKDLDQIVDNVFIIEHYKERKLSFSDALSLIRETHDSTLYDEPNALLEAKIELNLRTKKKTKFLESFRGIISYTNEFSFGGNRKIVAICKTEEDQEVAKQSGAELVGSSDIINMLKGGEISMENFDDLVCHGDMLIELANIKNTIGPFFPTKQRGNIGFDMKRLVKHFVNGFEYKLNKDNHEPDYGFVKIPFGRLAQTDSQLEDNFQTLLSTIQTNQPAGAPGDFISRVLFYSEPSPEMFPVAFWDHIDGYEDPNQLVEDVETDQEKKKAIKN